MTYCVGLKLRQGLVFMSDTRTNAGVDNVSTFRKMFTWAEDGESVVSLMTAGNLATTQSVVSLIEQRDKPASERKPAVLGQPSMFEVARLVGRTLKEVIARHAENGERPDSYFNATLIVGGQVKGGAPCLFLVYPEGNFIEADDDTPFLQIGEIKYGRPIIVRAFDPDMSFDAAVKLLLVSFDSTVKANLSVGLPLDLHVYGRDALRRGLQRRIGRDDPYFQTVSHGWGDALKRAFDSLPDISL